MKGERITLDPSQRQQLNAERTQAIYARLATLDEEMQQRISEKYYHGTRPWQVRKEGEAAPRRRRRASSESNESGR